MQKTEWVHKSSETKEQFPEHETGNQKYWVSGWKLMTQFCGEMVHSTQYLFSLYR